MDEQVFSTNEADLPASNVAHSVFNLKNTHHNSFINVINIEMYAFPGIP